jgi:hypothetical protein
MRDGKVVIDAVGHVFDFSEENRRPDVPRSGV